MINKIIKQFNYKSYLEIGVQKKVCFNNIKCKRKVSIDPEPIHKATYIMTSDEFFQSNEEVFDVVFIDGLHHADQVYKDILNALSHTHGLSTIICHDMNPKSEKMQMVPRVSKMWTGDCWKAWVKIRTELNTLHMEVIDDDFGVGVITKGGIQKKLVIDGEINYQGLQANRKEWLNITSTEEYFKHYK